MLKLLNLVVLFGVLLVAWHYHLVLNDDGYEGVLVAWYIAGALCLIYEREHIAEHIALSVKELAYENCR